MANTPLLNLDLIESGQTTLSDLIEKINENSQKLDAHDHSTGRGKDVALSSIVADSNLNMNDNLLIDVGALKLLDRTDSSTLNATLYFRDGDLWVNDGSGRAIKITHQGSSGINNVTLGPGDTALFALPAISSQTLTATTANTPVSYSITSITGDGLTDKLSQSVVSNVARINILDGGYVNLTWQDEIQLVSSTAGGSGNRGILGWVITQYESDGTAKRFWFGSHLIESPGSNLLSIPFEKNTGLTPVEDTDYFTFSITFESTRANDTAQFNLSTTEGEKIEVVHFGLTEVNQGPTGPQGPVGPAGPQGPAGSGGADSVIANTVEVNENQLQFDDGEGTPYQVNLPGLTVEDEGTVLGGTSSDVTTMDFTGTNVTATKSGNKVTVNVQGDDSTAINFGASEADTAKELKVPVEETTPAGGGSQGANLTFVESQSSNGYWEVAPSVLGGLSDTNLRIMTFADNDYSIANLRGRYGAAFRLSYMRDKSPINIIVDDTHYPVTLTNPYGTIGDTARGVVAYTDATIPAGDRPDMGDPEKLINVQFTANSVLAMARGRAVGQTDHVFSVYPGTGDNRQFDFIVVYNEGPATTWLGVNHPVRSWNIFRYGTNKEPEVLFINGRQFSLSSNGANGWVTSVIPSADIDFQASDSRLNFGINIRFTDGSYVVDSRSLFLTDVPDADPEVRAQKVLTKAGVVQWLQGSFTTGGGSPDTGAQIVTKLEGLSGDDRLAATAIKNLPDERLVVLENLPTDLTPYANGQVLRIKNPAPGEWREVIGSDSGEQHLFKLEGMTDPNNSIDWGVSLTGDTYGKIKTWDGGKELTASTSPVLRMEIQDDTTDDLVLLIAKSATSYADAPTNLHIRFYQGEIGTSNYVLENGIQLNKQADNTAQNYVSYAVDNADVGDVARLITDRQYIIGFGLFTTLPAQTDQTTNAFNLHSAKTTTEFDPATAVWAQEGQPAPVETNYSNAEADTDKALKVAVEETTPGMAAGEPVATPSTFTFVGDGVQYVNSIALGYDRLIGTRSIGSANLSAVRVNISPGNTYWQKFLLSFTKTKFPVAILIGDNSYSFTFQGDEDVGLNIPGIYYSVGNIPAGDRVTATSLSKMINYELVDNLNITLVEDSDGFAFTSLAGSEVFQGVGYWKSDFSIAGLRRKWTATFRTLQTKTVTHLVVNGMEYPATGSITNLPSGATTIAVTNSIVTDANFIGTATDLTHGINVKFSDGTYAIDTRSYLFQTQTPETPEIKLQKVLTKSGVVDWLGDSFSAIGSVFNTPERVTALPAEADSKEGEQVWLEDGFTHANGVNITPQLFAGTELDSVQNPSVQSGVGSRGWYAKPDAGFEFGDINPPLPDDFVLISDTRVYVKRNTQTNLATLYLGSTTYSLTRVPQAAGTKIINKPELADTEPDVDYYTITGGLPTGDWDGLRFETTTKDTFVPASTTETKGLYEYRNSDWVKAGFYAPALNPGNDFKMAVEEVKSGGRQDYNLSFVASGSTFTVLNPFIESPEVLRLTYNNSSTDTDTYQRYTVFIDLDGFQDSHTPIRLKIGSVFYSFAYLETESGQAVYRTPIVATANRLTSAQTVNGMNIQFSDQAWAGHTGETTHLRTVDYEGLTELANALQSVHVPPTNPRLGQRIEMLADYTVAGGAVMTAAEKTGLGAGTYTGYFLGSLLSGQTTDLGSLMPPNANFGGLVSYSQSQTDAELRNKTSFTRAITTYNPNKVSINGIEYDIAADTSLVDYFILSGLDGSFFRAGEIYYVNVKDTAGTPLYPDVVLKQGEIYFWTGTHWEAEVRGLTQDEVDGRINNKIPQQFRSDATTTGGLFQPAGFWLGSSTQYTALTKDSNTIYFVTE